MGRGVQREVPGTHTLWLIARCCPIQPPWRLIVQSTKMLSVQSLCCSVSISTIYSTKTCLRKIAFGSSRSRRFACLCLHCPCFIHAPRNVGNVETTGHKWTNGKRSAERSRRVSVYLIVLVGFVIDTGRGDLRREKLNWKHGPTRLVCGTCFWMMTDVGRLSRLCVCAGKTSVLARLRESWRAGQEAVSLCRFCFSSCLHLPALSSRLGFPQCIVHILGYVSQIKAFMARLFLVSVLWKQ